MKISNKVVAALGLAGTMFAGGALADGNPDFSQAIVKAPFSNMKSGDKGRLNCEAGEYTAAFFTTNSPVVDLSRTITVNFACLKQVGGKVVVVSLKQATNMNSSGFKGAGPMALGADMDFIFEAL